MLSKEQIDNIKELAAKATQGEWNDAPAGIVFSIIDGVERNIASTSCGANMHGNARFIAAANPAAVLELIAMLEAAQKDAARWRHTKDCIEYRNTAEWLEYSVQSSTSGIEFESRIDADMQRDCDGSHHERGNQ